MNNLCVIILAAGEGTRMKSSKPKVLQKLCGRSLVEHVVDVSKTLTNDIFVVIGHGGEDVKEHLKEKEDNSKIQFILQKERLGTGDAVKKVLGSITSFKRAMVLCGDAPLLTRASIEALSDMEDDLAATVLTAKVPNPTGYGRIIRTEKGEVTSIVEDAGATEAQKKVSEINTGTWCFSVEILIKYLPLLRPDPLKGEYYLTDMLEMLVKDNYRVKAVTLDDYRDGIGINDFCQLSDARKIMQCRINNNLMLNGVDIVDPVSTYIDSNITVQKDTIIYPQTILEGSTHIGAGCRIGPSSHLVNTTLEENVVCRFTVAEEAVIRCGAVIGPYAYLRPGTDVGPNAKIGDFVEVKNSVVGSGSKIPHLSYIGDCDIGAGVNFGAGTIVVNYDGMKKYRSNIGSGAFIGCNSNLISPLTIGEGAYVAAGSTLTQDVPDNALSVGRSRQVNKPGLACRFLQKKKDIFSDEKEKPHT